MRYPFEGMNCCNVVDGDGGADEEDEDEVSGAIVVVVEDEEELMLRKQRRKIKNKKKVRRGNDKREKKTKKPKTEGVKVKQGAMIEKHTKPKQQWRSKETHTRQFTSLKIFEHFDLVFCIFEVDVVCFNQVECFFFFFFNLMTVLCSIEVR